MLPAAWAAWKAASPLIKYGVLAGLILALWGWYVAQREYHQYQGRLEAAATQERELRLQAQAASEEAVRERQRALGAVSELIAAKTQLGEKLEAIRKERARHAKQTPATCPVDAAAVRMVNDLGGVLNDLSAPQERLPHADASAGGTALETEAAVAATQDALLERIAELTKRNAVTEEEHKQLSKYVIEKYEADVKFYLGQQPDE